MQLSALSALLEPLRCNAAPVVIPDELLFSEAPQLLVSGPRGMNQSAALADAGERLADAGHTVVHINCRNANALERLLQVDPSHSLLMYQGEFASFGLVKQVAARALAATAPLIIGLDDSNFDAKTHEALARLRDQDYELAVALQNLRLVPVTPWNDHSIVSLVHANSATQLDALTVDAIRVLAVGRPMWALELVFLANQGGISVHPIPQILQFDPVRWNSVTTRDIRLATSELRDDESAAALALSELDQISLSSANQMFGSNTVAALIEHNVLVPSATVRSQLTPVPLLTGPLRQRVKPQALTEAKDAVASHLVSIAELGVALREPELEFCAAQFSTVTSLYGEASSLSTVPAYIQAQHLSRAAHLAADFGRHDSARSLLVLAMRHSNENDAVEIARAIGSRDSSLTALSRIEAAIPDHPDAPWAVDALSATYLTRLLRTELGIIESTPNDGSFGLFEAWCCTDPIEDQAGRLPEIASDPAVSVQLRLLADSLSILNDTVSGRLVAPLLRARAAAAFETLTRPATSRNALERDAISTYLLTLAVTDLLSFGSVKVRSFRGELARLDCAESHVRWLRLLEAASLALGSGDASQAVVEWRQLLNYVPRFTPPRLFAILQAFMRMLESAAGSECDSLAPRGYLGMYLSHWMGDLTTAASLDPFDHIEPGQRSPMLCAIHEVVTGTRTENPALLQRAGQKLAELDRWATAARAFSHARQILLRRRSSGAIVACNQKIADVVEAAQAVVPWNLELNIAADVEKPPGLTQRETEIAQLAARGESNRGIADSLSLSVRTVESHLAQARAKLGASSRADLAAHLHGIQSA